MLADRIVGSLLMVLGVAVGLATLQFYIPYQYEPVGPKALPLVIGLTLVVAGVWLLAKPQPVVGGTLFDLRRCALAGLLVSYALLYEPLGFALATLVVMPAVASLSGARPIAAIVGGVLFSGVGHLLLVELLGLQLPLGWWWH